MIYIYIYTQEELQINTCILETYVSIESLVVLFKNDADVGACFHMLTNLQYLSIVD